MLATAWRPASSSGRRGPRELGELDGDDPVAEDGEAITPDDPAAGVKRATPAFRELLGRTAVERKAEALEIYHKKLHRRSGERVGDWCTRFRSHMVQLRQEGAEPPAQGQGFMLRGRSGLSEAQVQLLDTLSLIHI